MSSGFIGDVSWRALATYSASSEAAGYPATQAAHDELARVWRSTDATEANTVFTITLDDLRTVNVVALCNHNLSRPNSAIRVRLYSDTAMTVLTGDSGIIPVWDVIYTESDPQASWDSGNAWDRIMQSIDVANRQFDKAVYFTDGPVAVKIKIEIFDEENPDLYVQVGIIEVAQGFFLPLNFEYGAQYGIASRTKVTEAEGGAKYTSPATPRDVFRGGSGLVERQDALSLFYEFLRRTDQHTFFWWSPDIDDSVNSLRHSFLARNEQVDLLTMAAWNRDNVTFNFERVL